MFCGYLLCLCVCWHARIEMQINERICKLKSKKKPPQGARQTEREREEEHEKIIPFQTISFRLPTTNAKTFLHGIFHSFVGNCKGIRSKVKEFQRTGSGSSRWQQTRRHRMVLRSTYLDKYICTPTGHHHSTTTGSGFWVEQEKRMRCCRNHPLRNIVFKGELLCINYNHPQLGSHRCRRALFTKLETNKSTSHITPHANEYEWFSGLVRMVQYRLKGSPLFVLLLLWT